MNDKINSLGGIEGVTLFLGNDEPGFVKIVQMREEAMRDAQVVPVVVGNDEARPEYVLVLVSILKLRLESGFESEDLIQLRIVRQYASRGISRVNVSGFLVGLVNRAFNFTLPLAHAATLTIDDFASFAFMVRGASLFILLYRVPAPKASNVV